MKIISIFNNKGGVGKTTYMYHIAHLLAREEKTVLLVDVDPQCNLSAYALSDAELEKSWLPSRGNSIWNAIEKVYRGIGDIGQRGAKKFNANYENLYIIPGDVLLSNFEDLLGDTWSSAKGGAEPALRVQSAIYRYITWAANAIKADVVMMDLGPNLGPLNRCALSASNYFIIPMSPDLFSIRGTENLGNKLRTWRNEWDQCNKAWSGSGIQLPTGNPIFLGYVMQQHNVRSNETGMTRGWSIFGEKVSDAIVKNIINKISTINQVHDWGDGNWNLGQIPNLHSLIPYSQNARKPVYDCTSRDGLTGAHITRAKETASNYTPIVNRLLQVI